MKLRHRIIRWLAFSDTIFINAELDDYGVIRSRNAGTMLLSNLTFRRWSNSSAINIGMRKSDAALRVMPYGSQGLLVKDVGFYDAAIRARFHPKGGSHEAE